MKSPINNTENPQAETTPPRNVLEAASANGSFETFGKAVEIAGLGDTLRSPGPYTVFAPTDAAFELLPTGVLETLYEPENKEELISILNYHMVSGRKSIEDVGKWTAARTLNGQPALITRVENQLSIDGAKITNGDIHSNNGVLHGIDKVIMPIARVKH